MNYISDVDYYDELFQDMDDDDKTDYYDFRFAAPDTGDVNKITNYKYGPFANGQSDFLDGCVVQFFTTGDNKQQIFYNNNNGKFGYGYLSVNNNDPSTDGVYNANTKFLLQWDGASGYFLWPMNGDKSIQIFFDPNDGTINGFSVPNDSDPNRYKKLPKGYEYPDRVFKLSNNTVDNLENFITNLLITDKNGNFPIYVKDGKVGGGNGNAATPLLVKFITLGIKAWQLLIQKDSGISSYCCFSNIDMTPYTNFTTACNNSGFSSNSANCNGVVPKACSLNIKDGFDNPNCKDWCIANPRNCFTSINDWCQKTENVNKNVCACFNQGKFEKFKQDFTKNCKNCKISDLTPGCFYPACFASHMNNVANQGRECPANTSIYQNCIQNLTNQSGGNLSAGQVVQLCQLNAGEVDALNPTGNGSGTGGSSNGTGGNGSGTVGGGGGTGTGTTKSSIPEIAPAEETNTSNDNSFQNFWSKYQLYIIIGIVVLVILIAIAIFVSMKK